LGRVWLQAGIGVGHSSDGGKQPDFFAKAGASNKFAQYFPMERGNKQVAVYDPEKREISEIDTCFTTDHNEFGADGSLFFGQNGSIGWVNTSAWDRTHNEEASQGWIPSGLDTNGDGRSPSRGPNRTTQSILRRTPITFGCYSISVSPADGCVVFRDRPQRKNAGALGIEVPILRKLVLLRSTSPPKESRHYLARVESPWIAVGVGLQNCARRHITASIVASARY